MMNAGRTLALGLALAATWCAAATLDGSFERGDQAPAGWRLEGKGTWEKTGHTGARSASVTGTGEDSSFWRTTDALLAAGQLYQVSFWAKADKSAAGCVISGPSSCNRDFGASGQWTRNSFVFVAPEDTADTYLRFGQWHVPTRVLFDDVALQPAQAIHERRGDLVLGDGEEVRGRTYRFAAPLGGHGANHARPLHRFRCGFNSNRWAFHSGAEVVYRFAIPGAKQTAATVEATSSWFSNGRGVISASADGKAWTPVGKLEAVGSMRADVPKSLLPADQIFVRIVATGKESDTLNSKPGNFQIHGLSYTAALDADVGHLEGSTAYAIVEHTDPQFPVRVISLPSASPDSTLAIQVKNASPQQATLGATVTLEADGREDKVAGPLMTVDAGGTGIVRMPMSLRRPGENTLSIIVHKDNAAIFRSTSTRHVAILHDASYGHLLGGPKPVGIWWCEGTYKVSQVRALPAAPAGKPTPVTLAAARNEYEPVQLVLRPEADLKNLRIEVGQFTGREGRLDAKHVRIEQVEYVYVKRPTDGKGARGWWPDPLPPFEQGATLKGGRNHPLWITVHVPPAQAAGDYRGAVHLRADGWSAEVPVYLHVYDFALPKMASMQTGFGLSVSAIRRYHNLASTGELRQVLDLYHQNFAAHRIAPYDPAPLDPIRVSFATGPWEGGTLDTTDPKEGKRCLKIMDDKPGSSVAASNTVRIPVDVTKPYRFSWWVKTEKPAQPYLVTLQQYDADDQWMSGNNIDTARRGSGKWEQVTLQIPGGGNRPFNPKAKFVRVSLRPAPYSDRGEAMGTAWFDDVRLALVDARKNLVTDPGFEREPGELKATVDFTTWDKAAARTLGDLGFNSFRYTLRGMGGGTFHARHPGRIGSYEAGTPEYEKLMASQGRQVVEHFKAKGWLDRSYMYWFDEPDKKDYQFVADGMDLIQRAAPGLTRMLTEQPEEGLTGHVDLWCPVVSAIDAKTIAERQKHGERFWWYLCCGPKAPYIGLFVDRPAVDLRVWAWLSRKWGVVGQLVWTSNYWTSSAAFPSPKIQNPWDDPMSYVSGYSYQPGQIGYWGNGDGRFLYPPNRAIGEDKKKYLGGPINSTRWEMIREGLEDYEYFVLLDAAIAAAKKAGKPAALIADAERLAQVPDRVIADDKTYSADPQPLHTHRRSVAEMVEMLGGASR